MGPVQMEIVVWNKLMPHGKKDEKKIRQMADSKKKVLATWHSIILSP